MVWWTGLLVVAPGVAIPLYLARRRQERQRRESTWNHLRAVVGQIQKSSGGHSKQTGEHLKPWQRN